MMKRWMGASILVLGVLFPGIVVAEDSPPADCRRCLHGHTFLPSKDIADPFATTHFAAVTGLGYAGFTVDDGNGGTTDYKAAAIEQRFDFQLSPIKYLGLRLSFGGNALSGVDAGSALVIGTNVGYAVGAGVLGSLWGNDWVHLGVLFDYAFSSGYKLNASTAIQNSINQGTLTSEGLLTKAVEHAFNPGFALAFSPYKMIGLLTSLRFPMAKPDGGAFGNAVSYGIVLSLDISTVAPVPIAFTGMYGFEKGFEQGARLQHFFGGGLFYSGRRNLALGVEANVSKSSPEAGIDQMLILAQVALRYYW